MLDVEHIISNLTEDEKSRLIASVDWWHTYAIPRLNVPALRFSDGPNGVRGQRHFNSTKTTCFPSATGLAATWNKELIYQTGELLSEECKLKGARLLLGPTINILRGPLGGRAFESFSEDPVLSGLLASEYIKGVQDNGVACSLKHFVCNDQEHERNSADSIVSDRTLREIYLLPFQLAIRDAKPLSIMTSYNRVNGTHVSESKDLIKGVLRQEWGFDGMVISDWTGTYSTVELIEAGLDLELPGPSRYRNTLVSSALKLKKLRIEDVEDRCREVLKLINRTDKSGIQERLEEKLRDFDQDRPFLRQLVAEGMVLLKRDPQVLPLKSKKTAVIGYNAAFAAYAGGGSSLCKPYYKISPLQAITEKLGEDNVVYEPGAYSFKFLPSLGDSLKLDDGVTTGSHIKVYNNPPDFDGDRDLVDELDLDDIGYFRMNDYFNPKFHDRSLFYADIVSNWYPEQTGTYLLGMAVHGTLKLYIDGKLIVDNATEQEHGSAFYGQGASEKRNSFYAEKGRVYRFHVEFGSSKTSKLSHSGPQIGGGGGLICGGILDISPEDAIERAAKLALEVDQVVVVSGLNKEWESEGADRPDMCLPPYNDEMISRVLEANPNAVVVIQLGSPIDMRKWVQKCENLIYCSYGGNETGTGMADVIFGDVNPSGKLPLTFPLRLQDNPTYLNFGAERGKIHYGEGVYIGHRYYEKIELPVLFPFGYGLSYTKFEFSNLKVDILDKEEVEVEVTNTGSVAGSEVVQVYVSQLNPSIKRPVKELKQFSKVHLQPGETKKVKMQVSLKYATSFWDEYKDAWISEKDQYEVLVGNSSDSSDFLRQKFATKSTFWWNGV